MPFSEDKNLKLLIARMDSAQEALKSFHDAYAMEDGKKLKAAYLKAIDHFKGHTLVALHQGGGKPWFMYHI